MCIRVPRTHWFEKKSPTIYKCVVSELWVSESCHTYERVMSHRFEKILLDKDSAFHHDTAQATLYSKKKCVNTHTHIQRQHLSSRYWTGNFISKKQMCEHAHTYIYNRYKDSAFRHDTAQANLYPKTKCVCTHTHVYIYTLHIQRHRFSSRYNTGNFIFKK